MPADLSSEICVFSPGLRLTVTVESGPRGEEIHLHPGGQGYWLARSIERLGSPVVLCATVGGEVGDVLIPLLESQNGIELVAVDQSAPSSVSIYDRRSGSRTLIARSEPSSMDRHAVDKLGRRSCQCHASRSGIAGLRTRRRPPLTRARRHRRRRHSSRDDVRSSRRGRMALAPAASFAHSG